MIQYSVVPARPTREFKALYGAYTNPITGPRPNGSGIIFNTWLGSCGVGWLQGFLASGGIFQEWREEAAWISALYREMYQPGNILYALADNQLKNAGHLALINLGSKAIDSFPNLTHGSAVMTVFRVNIRNAVGRYCNEFGEPYDAPPKDDSEVKPEQTTPITGWMYLPKRTDNK